MIGLEENFVVCMYMYMFMLILYQHALDVVADHRSSLARRLNGRHSECLATTLLSPPQFLCVHEPTPQALHHPLHSFTRHMRHEHTHTYGITASKPHSEACMYHNPSPPRA